MTKKICETSVTKDPFKPDWVCTLCYPWMMEIGYVFPLGWLVYNKEEEGSIWSQKYEDGKFAFLRGQGHGNDEILFFDEKPYVTEDIIYIYDLFQGINSNELMTLLQRINEFKPDVFNQIMSLEDHAWCKFSEYMFKRTMRVLNNWENKFNTTVEDYYHSTFFPPRVEEWKSIIEELKS